jgi:MFS family permease
MDAQPAVGTDGQVAAQDAQDLSAYDRIGAFGSLRFGQFRLLIAGTVLTNAAQWIQQVTLGWLVYDLTGSGTMLGSINLMRAGATLGLAPAAGVAIDRIERRLLMFAVDLWLLVISLTLGLVLIASEARVWYLFLFAFLGGVAQAVDQPLRQTAAFLLVPRRFVPNAVALIQTGWSVMRSLAPGLGGFLLLWFGPGGNFLIQASAYALIGLTIWKIRFPPRVPASRSPTGLRTLAEGVRFVTRTPMTRTFIMMGWVLPLFIIPNFSALPPIYAKDVFDGGPQVLGLLVSAAGIGGIIGGIFSASISHIERRGLVQLTALLLLGVSLIGFSLTRSLLLALPLQVAAGFFEMVFLTTNQTLLQLSIPDELRGRVTSVASLNMALSPLGAFFAGAGAEFLGPARVTQILCSIAVGIAVTVLLRSRTLRELSMSRAIQARPADDEAATVPIARGGPSR